MLFFLWHHSRKCTLAVCTPITRAKFDHQATWWTADLPLGYGLNLGSLTPGNVPLTTLYPLSREEHRAQEQIHKHQCQNSKADCPAHYLKMPCQFRIIKKDPWNLLHIAMTANSLCYLFIEEEKNAFTALLVGTKDSKEITQIVVGFPVSILIRDHSSRPFLLLHRKMHKWNGKVVFDVGIQQFYSVMTWALRKEGSNIEKAEIWDYIFFFKGGI